MQRLGGDVLIHGSSSNDKQVIITDAGFIGIGTATPSTQLDMLGKFRLNNNEEPVIAGSSVLGSITNQSSTSNSSSAFTRIGLEIKCSNQWSSNALAKNIGIYVSEVSGQSSTESNIAAVLNGSTVIGNLTGESLVGTGGVNVLAIQNGAEPATQTGSTLLTNGGIQIYSVSGADGTSVFHLMNGDGTVIKLYRAAALTPADNSSVSSTTYGTTEADVIINLRNRINELESKLQALGILN